MLSMQSRMARAGLGWSIDKAAEQAGVGANTISRLENEQEIGSDSSERIRAAYNEAGIEFREKPDEGLCVCFAKPQVHVYRRASWVPGHDYIVVGLAIRNERLIVFARRDLLDDLDRWGGGSRSEEKMLASFQKNRALILQAAERAHAAGQTTPDKRIYLGPANFPKGVL